MAAKISKEISDLKEEVEEIISLRKEIADLKELVKIGEEDLSKDIKRAREKVESCEVKAFLSGKYDKGNAVLSIYSGAGGQDAQDWVSMLLRMYLRYCEREGFKTKILDQSFGEGGGPDGRIGIKQVTLEIKGKFAFGKLKRESGAHRLVRLSPFSSQQLRHTSFARVEVLPEIPKPDELEIKINPEDLKLDTFRASGPGGQYVNKRESAVRITHLPTGITVSCQSERLQGLNRQKAEALLYSKLYQYLIDSRKKEIKKVRGKSASPSWGNQIRSYIFHPYKLVKDYRTEVETSKVEEVLDGNLNDFIKAEIKID